MLTTIQNLLQAEHYLTEDARAIARTRCWEALDGNEKLLYGLYRTKRSRYSTFVDLRHEKLAFRCNCRSRKNPCKHSLALLILLVEQSDAFRVTDEFSEEMQTWLHRRDNRLAPKERTAEEEAKLEDIRRQNWDKRLQQMSKGLHDLELWLLQTMEEGLASLHQREAAYWDSWSAALVNAKLGSLAKRVKALPRLFQQADWHEEVLAELGELYLLVKGFQHIDHLAIDFQQELFNTLGVNVKKEEVLKEPALSDRWWVLAKHEGAEDNLSFRRVWLLGEQTGMYALLLDFSWGGQGFPNDWKAGTVLKGELCFYPAQLKQRALVKQFIVEQAPFEASGFPDLLTFNAAYRLAIAANPWLSLFPACLGQVRPVLEKEQLFVIDLNGLQLPCRVEQEGLEWKLIALSAGQPIQLFGVWDGNHFLPLSALVDGRFIDFSIHYQRPKRQWQANR